MGRRKTGGYRSATKTYKGSRSGTQARGTTGGGNGKGGSSK